MADIPIALQMKHQMRMDAAAHLLRYAITLMDSYNEDAPEYGVYANAVDLLRALYSIEGRTAQGGTSP